MSNQFTVGPWRVEGDQHLPSGLRVNVRVISGTDLIADVPKIENARLIAAAPALYDNLVAAVSFLQDDSRSERRRAECLRSFRDALALVDSKNGEL